MKNSLALCALALLGLATMARADVSFDGYWSELRPPWRTSHTLTYDPVGQRMVLFGGDLNNSNSTARGETWLLELGATPAWDPAPGTPPPRDRHTAVYDSARQRLLVYGGRGPVDPVVPLSDTWAYDLAGGTGWTELQATGGDPAPERQLMSAIYDPINDRMLVVFGTDGFAYYNDVWALDLSGTPAWHVLSIAGTPPQERRSNAAIYDPVRHRLITFGGHSLSGDLNDVWVVGLDGSPTWTQLTPTGTPPSPRQSPAVAYDSVHDRMLVFGGGSPGNDVWALTLGDNPAWTQLLPSGTPPSARSGQIAAYDPVRDELVVHGGGINIRSETWRLSLSTDPPVWTQEMPWGGTFPPREWHSAVYDGGRQQVVLFGGKASSYYNDAWTLSLSGEPSWHQLAPLGPAPEPRVLTSAIYDPVKEQVLVYGGLGTFELNDVWSLSLSGTPAWSQVTGVNTPPKREGPSAIYDSARQRMVTFGGNLSDVSYNDVWAMTLTSPPTWTQLTPAGTPPPARDRHTAIYDPVRDRMLVFGGYTTSGTTNDLWELSFSGTPTWTQLLPSGGPPPPEEVEGSAYDASRDRMLVMGYGAGEVWELTLAPPMAWRKLDPGGLGFPSGRSSMPIVYDPVGDQLVLPGGWSGGYMGDTWLLTFTPTVAVDPTPRSSTLSLAPLGSNPVRGDLVVSYSLPRAAPATLDLFDVRGRRVLGGEAPSSAGAHRWVVAPSGSLVEGVYWIRLTQAGSSAVRTVVVLH